ncbi:MAG: hypothetical protein WBL31_01525 [Ilumatobacteraceae bacterium]
MTTTTHFHLRSRRVGARRPLRGVGIAVGMMFALAASVAVLSVGARRSTGPNDPDEPQNAPVVVDAGAGAAEAVAGGGRLQSTLLDSRAFAPAVDDVIENHAHGSALLHPDEFAEAVAAVVD